MGMVVIQRSVIFVCVVLLAGCGGSRRYQRTSAGNDYIATYPQGGVTYLSFGFPHGYQVNYLHDDGTAWLWYPNNEVGVPEIWRVGQRNGTLAICFTHPSNTHNRVTGKRGGESCTALSQARRGVVGQLRGDPFNLRSGAVPYKRHPCDPPEAFHLANPIRCRQAAP